MDKFKIKYKANKTFIKEVDYTYLIECDEKEATIFEEQKANYIKEYIEKEEKTEIELIKIL